MPRLNVWVPEELASTVKTEMPDVNVSKVLQEGLRALLKCKHDQIVCAECALALDRVELVERAKTEFFRQLMWELTDLVNMGGTAEGAARIAKSVASAHQLHDAEHIPAPRPSRAQQRRNADARWIRDQGWRKGWARGG